MVPEISGSAKNIKAQSKKPAEPDKSKKGGKVTVASELGKGTKFTIVLPIKRSKTEFGQVRMFTEVKPTIPLA
jgi:hypothetical protein